jgi:hypothetical protein
MRALSLSAAASIGAAKAGSNAGNRAKQKSPREQRFPIIFQSLPVQTLRGTAKICFAFRGLDYHLGRKNKVIFSMHRSERGFEKCCAS